MNKGHIIAEIVMAVVIVLLSFFLCKSCKPVEGHTETHSDTVFVHSTDTLYFPKDSIIYKWKKTTDTLYLHDTVLIREQKCYQDSFSTIWISGIEPEIDSIIHFIPRDTVLINTETTTTVVNEKRVGCGVTFGIYAGGGCYYSNGKLGLAPEVGVGIVIGPTYVFKTRNRKSGRR